MPRLSTKHPNAEVVTFGDFSGGLNLAHPPESIGDNEMQSATNFEFSPDTGLLKVRGGLEPVYTFEDDVRDILPIGGGDACLVRSGDTLYRLVSGVARNVGTVDGDGPGVGEFWGDSGGLLLAFGGHLHLFDGDIARRVDSLDAPTKVNTVFYRSGRAVVTEAGSDTIRFSGVGDPERWIEGNDSDAVRVDVGYKDGCAMSATGMLVGELFVFKCPPGQPEHGRIYRLRGDYPDWSITAHSRGAAAWNPQAVANVANNMLFLTREGLSSLDTAMEYGDFRLSWAGAKINPKLAQTLTDNCRLWHVAIKGQVWAWDGAGEEVLIYHYQIGKGAWTAFRFPGPVRAVASVRGKTYLGIGKTVYGMNDSLIDDNLQDGREDVLDVRVPIDALWKPKTILRRNQVLLKGIRVNYLSTVTSDPVLRVEGLALPLPLSGQGDIAATDTDIAATDMDPLVPSRTSVVRKRCNIRRWDITPEIAVRNGLFSLSSVALEIAEV